MKPEKKTGVAVTADGATIMNEELIRVSSGQYDTQVVQKLTLSHLTIDRIDSLGECGMLTELDLSHNSLASLDGIEPVSATLQRLHIAGNRLTSVAQLATMKQLEVLHIEGNALSSVESLASLQQLPKLRALYLQSREGESQNPVCAKRKEYVTAVNSMFPKLRCLDGHYFCKEDVNPVYIDAGDDEEVQLPPSKPWITEDFFKSLAFDPAKTGAASEKAFNGIVKESRRSVSSAGGAAAAAK